MSETLGERMSAVEEWQEGHEKRCDDRQAAMGREIRDLKTSVKVQVGLLKDSQGDVEKRLDGLNKGAWAVVLALLAWASVQIYDGLKPPARGQVTIVAAQPK